MHGPISETLPIFLQYRKTYAESVLRQQFWDIAIIHPDMILHLQIIMKLSSMLVVQTDIGLCMFIIQAGPLEAQFKVGQPTPSQDLSPTKAPVLSVQ